MMHLWSLTTTLRMQLALFPEVSLATYVTSVSPTGKVVPCLWDCHTTGSIPELSEKTGSSQVTIADGLPLEKASGGEVQLSTIGGSLSLTTTEKLQNALFPAASSAQYVMSLVPMGNSWGGMTAGTTLSIRDSPLLSEASSSSQSTSASAYPGSESTSMSSGQFLIIGGSRSMHIIAVSLPLHSPGCTHSLEAW
uniref:Putative secreted protein n=1 Tax=Ixodes ricinus TaxID=34613 RepID=A0A6B0V1P1_IXORI